jgi:TPP-dependent indolepyruvate ferredoxin oxidoreductase alpha subunit
MNLFTAILIVSVYLVSTLGTTKPGSCPTPKGFGICEESCTNDNSCLGAMKCVRNLIKINKPYLFIENSLFKCSNGCGHTFQMPMTITIVKAATRTSTTTTTTMVKTTNKIDIILK